MLSSTLPTKIFSKSEDKNWIRLQLSRCQGLRLVHEWWTLAWVRQLLGDFAKWWRRLLMGALQEVRFGLFDRPWSQFCACAEGFLPQAGATVCPAPRLSCHGPITEAAESCSKIFPVIVIQWINKQFKKSRLYCTSKEVSYSFSKKVKVKKSDLF